MHTSKPIARLLSLCTVLFLLTLPIQSQAQSQPETKKSFVESDGGLTWGLATLELSAIGLALAGKGIFSLSEDGNIPVIVAFSLASSSVLLGGPPLVGHYASKEEWSVVPPAATMAFLSAGLGGYAVGCGLEALPLTDPGNWDITTFGACRSRPLPWVLGGISGLLASLYIILQGDKLFTEENKGGEWAAYAPLLMPIASFTLQMSIWGFTAIGKTLSSGGGKAFVGENQLFPSGRGYLMTFGLTQMGMVLGTFIVSEFLRPD